MLLDLELIDSRPLGTKSGFGRPLIRAAVNGQSTLLLVDTAATETLFSRRLLGSLNIGTKAAIAGTDHAGAEVPTWVTTDTLFLELGGHHLELNEVAAIETPNIFEDAGIGGILRPQHIFDAATLRLDLRGRRMMLSERPFAKLERADSAPFSLIPLALKCERLAGEFDTLIAFSGRFDRYAAGNMLINTGVIESEVAPDEQGVALPRPVAIGRGLSGSPVLGQVVNGTYFVARAAILASGVIIRQQPAGIAGQFGMDVLGATCLDITAEGEATWWIPQEWVPHQ